MPILRNVNRKYRDVSSLTPYEQKIWDLHKEGLSAKDIADHVNTKHASTISSRLRVIKEKMEVCDENREDKHIHRQQHAVA